MRAAQDFFSFIYCYLNRVCKFIIKEGLYYFRMLITAYDDRLDNVDVYVGGMLESYGQPGEFFTVVIKEQFERLRDADRVWFENDRDGSFRREEIEELRQITK